MSSSSKKKSKAPRNESTTPAPTLAPASVHEGVATRGDGTAVRVSVPRDEPEAPPTREESERLAATAAVFGPEVLGPAPETPTTTGPAGPDAATTPTPPAKGKKGGTRAAGGTKAPGAKSAASAKPAAGKAAAPKTAKAPKPPKERQPKRVSLLDAAATILASAKEPMSAKEIVADVLGRRMWSTKGETPEATLYAAMIREIAAKKGEGGARFKKVDRGLFVATGK